MLTIKHALCWDDILKNILGSLLLGSKSGQSLMHATVKPLGPLTGSSCLLTWHSRKSRVRMAIIGTQHRAAAAVAATARTQSERLRTNTLRSHRCWEHESKFLKDSSTTWQNITPLKFFIFLSKRYWDDMKKINSVLSLLLCVAFDSSNCHL